MECAPSGDLASAITDIKLSSDYFNIISRNYLNNQGKHIASKLSPNLLLIDNVIDDSYYAKLPRKESYRAGARISRTFSLVSRSIIGVTFIKISTRFTY